MQHAVRTRQLATLALVGALMCSPVMAQGGGADSDSIPVFHATAVSRSTKSINFHYRQGSTELSLVGTAFAPKAKGTVRADSKPGATKLDVRVDNLPAPWSVNESALTYVVWAITPDGRPEPVGELTVGTGDDAHLVASSELQAFGLIVTAEPYFAVTQPSDVVVMEAAVTPQTAGTIQSIDAKFELLPRDAYLSLLPPARQAQMKIRDKSPIDLLQARHAVAIAESFGASTYAADTIRRAHVDLKNAEDFFASGADKKKVETLSRGVVQLSEDARLISVRRRTADSLEQERLTAAKNLEQAQTDVDRLARQKALAEAESRVAQTREAESRQIAGEERRRSELAAREAARANEERMQAQAETEAARRTVASSRQQAEAAIDARQSAEKALQEAEANNRAALEARQTAELRASEATRLLADARAQQTALGEEAERAKRRAEQAEADRTRAREELRKQLNLIFVTTQTARGLVVNMSDVLFDFGKYKLNPGAREKLAKVAGILQLHSQLNLAVEGHTDDVGSDSMNLKLSSERAQAVRDYLVEQGVKPANISSLGKGESAPVASNATAAGRQQNRRVEIIVSGPDVDPAIPGF